MLKFRKPETIPLLFIIASVLLTGALGVWQLQRLAWKEQVIAGMHAAQTLPALGTLPESPDNLSYRKVALTGRFLYDKRLRMIGRQFGHDVGYFMLTPFVLDDDGRIILVNRGFAPDGRESKPEGLQTVTGIVRPLREKRLFSPGNHPEKNIWFYEDIAAMSQATGLTLLPVMVEVTGLQEKGVFPIPGDGKIAFRNDHLTYAVTWFSLMLVGLVMFGFYYHETEKKK
jgi:surfeit locus 1 family protein